MRNFAGISDLFEFLKSEQRKWPKIAIKVAEKVSFFGQKSDFFWPLKAVLPAQ